MPNNNPNLDNMAPRSRPTLDGARPALGFGQPVTRPIDPAPEPAKQPLNQELYTRPQKKPNPLTRMWLFLPKKHKILLLGIVSIGLIFAGLATFIFSPSLPDYVDKNLPKIDQERQIDLHEIKEGLEKYFTENNQQYPVFLQVEIDGTDPLTNLLVPLYLKQMPTSPDERLYTYSSLSGKSFLLRAALTNDAYYDLSND